MVGDTIWLFTNKPQKPYTTKVEWALWVMNAIAAVTLLILTQCEFWKITIIGVVPTVDLTFAFLYAMFNAFFTFLKEVRRWTFPDFQSSRLGHIFSLLWGLVAFEMALVSAFSPTHDFPTSVLFTNIAVWSTWSLSQASAFFHERKLRMLDQITEHPTEDAASKNAPKESQL